MAECFVLCLRSRTTDKKFVELQKVLALRMRSTVCGQYDRKTKRWRCEPGHPMGWRGVIGSAGSAFPSANRDRRGSVEAEAMKALESEKHLVSPSTWCASELIKRWAWKLLGGSLSRSYQQKSPESHP